MRINTYPRTPHLEGSCIQIDDDPDVVPDRDLAARSDCLWIVEEKIDGTNAGLSFDGAGDLSLQWRGHLRDVDGRPHRERHFNDFKTWARLHEAALLEHDLLDAVHPFADLTVRLACCRDADRDPRFASGTPEVGPLVTVLAGLPASGKSTLARALENEGAARISVEDRLDAGIERGRAIQDAREALRSSLRAGRDAVRDATMLTRTLRRQVVTLAEACGARCRIIRVEQPEAERAARNRKRSRPVPDDAVAGMLLTRDRPTHDEALIVEGRPARLGSDRP